ncbi:MAG: hypothetical protein LBS89_04825 [Zoogloeaceae bacterium]|jgi:hypothetical protein|nr:hypothetical protein [Zoogloeaceae bacterium]
MDFDLFVKIAGALLMTAFFVGMLVLMYNMVLRKVLDALEHPQEYLVDVSGGTRWQLIRRDALVYPQTLMYPQKHLVDFSGEVMERIRRERNLWIAMFMFFLSGLMVALFFLGVLINGINWGD